MYMYAYVYVYFVYIAGQLGRSSNRGRVSLTGLGYYPPGSIISSFVQVVFESSLNHLQIMFGQIGVIVGPSLGHLEVTVGSSVGHV